MSYTTEQCEELNILVLFDLASPHEGLKVHKTASPSAIAATRRLFDKGLISQVDGGYLTSIGQTAATHAQQLHTILS